MRLFIAVRFSSPVIKILRHCMEQLKSQALSASLTHPENLHLTLAFVGETNRVAAVVQAMDAAGDVPAFDVCIRDSGQFQDLWWVGIEQSPPLTAVAHRLQESLRHSGFPIEHRRFQPHITIARKVAANRPIYFEVPRISMTVDHLSLMSSDRRDGRLVYTEIARKVLPPSSKFDKQIPPAE